MWDGVWEAIKTGIKFFVDPIKAAIQPILTIIEKMETAVKAIAKIIGSEDSGAQLSWVTLSEVSGASLANSPASQVASRTSKVGWRVWVSVALKW